MQLPAGVRIGAVDLQADGPLAARYGIKKPAGPLLLAYDLREKLALRQQIALAPRWKGWPGGKEPLAAEAVAAWASDVGSDAAVGARRAQLAAAEDEARLYPGDKLRLLASKLASPAALGTAAAATLAYLLLTIALSSNATRQKAAAEQKRQAALDSRKSFEAAERAERAASEAEAEGKRARAAAKQQSVADAKARAAAKAALDTPEARRAAVMASAERRMQAAAAAEAEAAEAAQ
eukprot:SAG22_NODE_1661_length_3868_cov_5.701512_1_plen_236_part_00